MKPKKSDPNVSAHALVNGSGADAPSGPTELAMEAAWQEWSSHIQNIDEERVRSILRAAFEAGWEWAKTHPEAAKGAAAELGRMGGLKGGKARAEKLSADERRRIARKAAETRWSKPDSYK